MFFTLFDRDYWSWLSRTIDPPELPRFADNATFTVNRAFAAQLLKLIVAETVAIALGARFPAEIGSAVVIEGTQTALRMVLRYVHT